MIKIICVGKLKKKYLEELVNDYKKRITKYRDIEIIEVKDSNIKKEAELILNNIKKRDNVVVLDINGTKMDSIELAKTMDNWLINYANITFVIGGSDGVDDSVKEIANFKLSFGDLTYPHGLFRGLLLEQIYRGLKLLNNEPYHK